MLLKSRPDAAEEETILVDRARFARRRWLRRLRSWRKALALVLVVGLLATGTWLVFFSSVLAVTGVQIQGTDVLSPKEVRKAARVPMDVPLATVDLRAIKDRVENLAPVASVDVSRAWPHRVLIDVTERQAVAVVNREGVLWGLDGHGVLFRTYSSKPDLPLLQVSASTDSTAMAEAARVVSVLPSSLLTQIAYVDVRSIDGISFHLQSGAIVNWGSADSATQKSEVLQVLLKQKARVYDVTVPTRPTIRP